MAGEQMAEFLHRTVGKMRAEEFYFFQHRIGTPFDIKEEWHLVGAKFIDHQEGVFAVFFRDIVDIPVHVFPGNRQIFKIGQNMAADFSQDFRLIGADIKHLLIFLCCESVETYREYRQLTGAAGGFKQSIRVSVITCGGVGFDVTHAVNIIIIVGVAAIVAYIVIFDAIVIQFAEDLLRRFAQINPQMVDQRQFAVFINAREQRHFGIRRPRCTSEPPELLQIPR